MRLLLDTQVFLWVADDSSRLRPQARESIFAASEVFVSAASIWEIAIKARLGKINVDAGEMVAAIEGSGFQELPVTAQHAIGVEHLPLYHNDPFDRLLVAQALAEPMRLLTADGVLEQYTDLVIRA